MGDVIENCTLYHGDCLDVMAQMAPNSIDLTVTSPPYDKLRTYEDSLEWNEELWRQVIDGLWRVTADGGVVVWVVGDATVKGSETGTSFRQALYARECGFNLHDTMIWNKGNFTAVGSLQTRYAPVFDYMFVWTKGKIKTFNPIKDRKCKTAGSKKHSTIRQKDGSTKKGSKQGWVQPAFGQRHNIWDMPPENSNTKRVHPAQFPEHLANDHIISWSNPGDVVFDPFLGSGTTGKVALLNSRQFIGVEKVGKYFDIAKERLQNVKFEKGLGL